MKEKPNEDFEKSIRRWTDEIPTRIPDSFDVSLMIDTIFKVINFYSQPSTISTFYTVRI